MTSFQQAEAVARMIETLPQFKYPAVSWIGITKHDGEFAVTVNFIGQQPKMLPDRIAGVKIVYSSNTGKIVPF